MNAGGSQRVELHGDNPDVFLVLAERNGEHAAIAGHDALRVLGPRRLPCPGVPHLAAVGLSWPGVWRREAVRDYHGSSKVGAVVRQRDDEWVASGRARYYRVGQQIDAAIW